VSFSLSANLNSREQQLVSVPASSRLSTYSLMSQKLVVAVWFQPRFYIS